MVTDQVYSRVTESELANIYRRALENGWSAAYATFASNPELIIKRLQGFASDGKRQAVNCFVEPQVAKLHSVNDTY